MDVTVYLMECWSAMVYVEVQEIMVITIQS